MFKTKSQRIKEKQKQKQRPYSIPSGVGYSSTQNSSSSTLPVQYPTSPDKSMNSSSSLPMGSKNDDSVPLQPVVTGSSETTPPTPAQPARASLPNSKSVAKSATVTDAPPDPPGPISAQPAVVASTPSQSGSAVPIRSKPAPIDPAKKGDTGPNANLSSLVDSIPSEARPVGGRRGKSDDEMNGATRGGELVAGNTGGITTAGMQLPGKLLNEDEKSALKIKVHLNLHAKVRLDLDAQIYGDVVIGLM
ncbi:hypothetical protein N7478_006065 [Penicillium angulare]|uniref:uncharacterized protein n=1 Tax=Penicillium angulare TaxID=116970 RepID=UPI00253F873A|nr:uncharacterized protein N7478_006065 [Penicillium angulare]KAJ5280693.1 hypothetical protein N7478_006065 [Penicillium angulare]